MEIRPTATPDEVERLVEIMNDVQPDDPATPNEFLSWGKQAREHIDVLAWDGEGRAVGGSRTFLSAAGPDPQIRLWVDPAERRRGAGSALYAEASRWAADRGQSHFLTWVAQEDEDSLAFAERRGFVETGRDRTLVLDLTAVEPPKVDRPPGIELTTWAERPELTRGLYDVAVESVPDIPGEEGTVEPFEDWLAHDMQGTGDRPEATFVALAGDEVVGYAKFHLSEARPTIALHDLTGVKRAWRGRGIARALKAHQIRWAIENGYTRLQTGNEERNAPIRKLNERFGYRAGPGRISLRGPLASGGA